MAEYSSALARIFGDLLLELRQQRVEAVAANDAGVFRTLEGQVTHPVGDDVDDPPAAVDLAHLVTELDLAAVRTLQLRLHEHVAAWQLALRGRGEDFPAVAVEPCRVGGDTEFCEGFDEFGSLGRRQAAPILAQGDARDHG